MGTTRIKVIDLSGEKQEIKTSRKHAEKLSGIAKLKGEKKDKKAITEGTEKETESTESVSTEKHPLVFDDELRRISEVEAIPGKHPGGEKKVSKTVESPVARGHHLGKKYQEAALLVDKNKSYPTKEALELLLQTSITRFDPTVEVHLNVADKNLKISVNFPHPPGGKTKQTRYLIFSDSPSVITKNIIWGDESTIADIESGKLKPGRDFDAVLTQPKFMPALAKIAKILGPRGLMPNPKNGTVSQDPQKAIGQKDDGASTLALDPTAPILHTVIGKLSAKPQHLSQNLQALILAVGPTKIKKATINTTMGPGIKVDIDSISAN